MASFDEVAPRVWVARYQPYDVNVSVLEGSAGLLVVDTGARESAAAVLEDLRRLSSRPVVAILNTHCHHDHVQGNALLRTEHDAPPVTAHEAAAELIEPRPERVLSSVTTIDLGDRAVEVVHPGRGHTDGDVVVLVGDAGVLLAGDLVEESGHPVFGPDSFPLDWPLSLDLVLSLLTPDTVVVPGHGAPIDMAFVEQQRAAIGVVAETIRDLAGRGVSVQEALADGQWPYPAEALVDAIERGYQHLPRAQRRLPLV